MSLGLTFPLPVPYPAAGRGMPSLRARGEGDSPPRSMRRMNRRHPKDLHPSCLNSAAPDQGFRVEVPRFRFRGTSILRFFEL